MTPRTAFLIPLLERRHGDSRGFLRGQQILMRAMFHLLQQETPPAADDAVRFLLRHMTTQFRADDRPPRLPAVVAQMPPRQPSIDRREPQRHSRRGAPLTGARLA